MSEVEYAVADGIAEIRLNRAPVNALSLDLVESLIAALRRAAGDRTIIMVTHRTAPLAICDKVAFMMDGRFERVGTPAEILPYARKRMANEETAAQ